LEETQHGSIYGWLSVRQRTLCDSQDAHTGSAFVTVWTAASITAPFFRPSPYSLRMR